MTDSSSASLIGKQGMGGIHGGKGYKAQDAYLSAFPTFSVTA